MLAASSESALSSNNTHANASHQKAPSLDRGFFSKLALMTRRKCGDMLRFPLFFFVFPSVNLGCINKANDAVTAAIGDAELGSYYSAPYLTGNPFMVSSGTAPS